MTPPASEELTLAAARAGDEVAFSVLVERHRSALRAHCRQLLHGADAADDVVQETWIRAWRSLPGFEGRSSFRTWLHRIASNACIDARRRGTRDRSFVTPEWGRCEPTEPVAPSVGEPDARLLAKESAERSLLAAVAVLPPRQRAVLILRDVLRWSASDTAEVLHTTVPAVNSTLQRARATPHERDGPEMPPRAAGPRSGAERRLLERCLHAIEAGDLSAAFLLAAA